MPDPEAAGEIIHMKKQQPHAKSRLKAVYCKNLTNSFSFSSCKSKGGWGSGGDSSIVEKVEAVSPAAHTHHDGEDELTA